ncbi:MAG: hypothetical protein SH856_13855 [Flavobacteriales bacterium]|nr:hypothetical protein [Flavobacteriales bacterium]
MKKKARLAIWIGAGLVIGFVQEMVKVNINYQLDMAQRITQYDQLSLQDRRQQISSLDIEVPYDYYFSHSRIQALENFSIGGLNKLKWINTFFFIAVFMIINFRLLQIAIPASPVRKLLLPAYVVLFSASIIFYIFGHFTDSLGSTYPVARKIAGVLQSMIPAVILYFGHLLSSRIPDGNKNHP